MRKSHILKICITMQVAKNKLRKFWNLVRRQVYHWKGKITKCILKLSLIHNWLSYMHNLLRYSAYMILSEKAIESYVWIIMAIHIIHDLTVELKFTVLLKYSWVLMSNLSYSFSKYLSDSDNWKFYLNHHDFTIHSSP